MEPLRHQPDRRPFPRYPDGVAARRSRAARLAGGVARPAVPHPGGSRAVVASRGAAGTAALVMVPALRAHAASLPRHPARHPEKLLHVRDRLLVVRGAWWVVSRKP